MPAIERENPRAAAIRQVLEPLKLALSMHSDGENPDTSLKLSEINLEEYKKRFGYWPDGWPDNLWTEFLTTSALCGKVEVVVAHTRKWGDYSAIGAVENVAGSLVTKNSPTIALHLIQEGLARIEASKDKQSPTKLFLIQAQAQVALKQNPMDAVNKVLSLASKEGPLSKANLFIEVGAVVAKYGMDPRENFTNAFELIDNYSPDTRGMLGAIDDLDKQEAFVSLAEEQIRASLIEGAKVTLDRLFKTDFEFPYDEVWSRGAQVMLKIKDIEDKFTLAPTA